MPLTERTGTLSLLGVGGGRGQRQGSRWCSLIRSVSGRVFSPGCAAASPQRMFAVAERLRRIVQKHPCCRSQRSVADRPPGGPVPNPPPGPARHRGGSGAKGPVAPPIEQFLRILGGSVRDEGRGRASVTAITLAVGAGTPPPKCHRRRRTMVASPCGRLTAAGAPDNRPRAIGGIPRDQVQRNGNFAIEANGSSPPAAARRPRPLTCRQVGRTDEATPAAVDAPAAGSLLIAIRGPAASRAACGRGTGGGLRGGGNKGAASMTLQSAIREEAHPPPSPLPPRAPPPISSRSASSRSSRTRASTTPSLSGPSERPRPRRACSTTTRS